EHEELRESARGFIERELTPHAQTWEEEQWFPDEVFPKLAKQGLLGLKYPVELGGQGGDYLHEAVLCEEMARVGSGGTAAGNGARAHFIVTAVKTTKEGGHHGISFLIIERGEGVSSSKLQKLGWHASDTATIAFEDVFVPRENLLGGINEGFKLIMANFQWER